MKLLLITLLFLSGHFALAQDSDVIDSSESKVKVEVKEDKKEEEKKAEPTSDGRVEKLEVTGSYIKRIDIEGPSPVVTYDQENFDNAGVNTVSDFLRESSLFSGSTDSGNRDGYFRFRGQNAGATLILINGMRVPKLGGPSRGFYAGVENIPTNVIQRVEVLKDGSSALYGSDAMAGVINFITKKDYDGAEYSTRMTVPEAGVGFEQNHTLAFGQSGTRSTWFVSTQYVEQRGYTEANIPNRFNVLTYPTSTKSQFDFYQSATDQDERSTRAFSQLSCADGSTDPDSCMMDDRALQFVRDPRQNIGSLFSATYDINSDITAAFVGMYNRRSRQDRGMPRSITNRLSEGRNRLPVGSLSSTNIQSLSGGRPFMEYNIRPFDEIGARQIDIVQDSYSAQTKVEGYFLDTWKWDLSGSYAYSLEERDHRNGLVDSSAVSALMSVGAYDPTALGQNSGALRSAQVFGTEAYEADQTTARLVASGELFDMSDLWGTGGPLSLAIGTEGQWESVTTANDEILTGGTLNQIFAPNQTGGRSVGSIFTEMVMYPVESVEFQIAGRIDEYSDFGSTANPKLSLGWRPNSKVLVRTSWGTNFKAPAVSDMIAADRVGRERYAVCTQDAVCPNTQVDNVVRYRDNNLGPEKGVNFNLGTVIQPNKNWTFTIDQWNFEGQDTISAISSAIYSDSFNAIGLEGLEAAGVTFEFDENGLPISVRAPRVSNMGTRTIRGIDFNINFDSPLRLFGRVFDAGFNMEHTHMLAYENRQTPTSPIENRRDLEWKNTLSFTLATKQHSYRLAARTLAGDSLTNFRGVVRTHTEYDFNYNWDIPYWSGRFNIGVKNLLNTNTPTNLQANYVDLTTSFNSYAFLPIGRRYYVGYSHTF